MTVDEQLIYDYAVRAWVQIAKGGELVPAAYAPILSSLLIAISNNNIAAAIRETIQDELTPMETGETVEEDTTL